MHRLYRGCRFRFRLQTPRLQSQGTRREIFILTGNQLQQKKSGCFGLEGLHRPNDWDKLSETCVATCFTLAEEIRAQSDSPSAKVLHDFDELSNTLCNVLDVAELCRNVHPNPEFCEAANKAYADVSSVVLELNADQKIYDAINQLHQQFLRTRDSQDPADEDTIMITSMKDDFERGGIGLRALDKVRLLDLQEELNQLCQRFVEPRDSVVTIPKAKLPLLPTSVLAGIPRKPLQGGVVQLSVTGSSAQQILKWTHDSEIRERVYRALYKPDNPKISILDSILDKRLGLARLLGQKSYAELLFSNRLASSPEEVQQFLRHLSSFVRGSAESEAESLMKKNHQFRHTSQAGTSERLHGWDRSFLIGRFKADEYGLSSTEVAGYFPLSACLMALSEVVRLVFGLNIRKVEPLDEELWHHDVEKFEVVDQHGDVFGIIFLDLFPRPGKYGHAAHFSIRSGRQPRDSSEYQTPIVALVCNFGTDTNTGQQLLSVSEYETLFHEFGHSIHSILSRTKYQHLSGTRVATDLVELPSHLFEHFAWDPRVISRFARHHRTGDPLPTRMLRSLCVSRHGLMAIDLQTQILLSTMDLEFHGPRPPSGGTTGFYESLQQELTVFEPDGGIAVPATFHHFVGYGAGYYSYLFAKILSAQIWETYFQKDPFSREGGDKLRHGFLARGGAREPQDIIQDLLPQGVNCSAALQPLVSRASNTESTLRLPIRRSSHVNVKKEMA